LESLALALLDQGKAAEACAVWRDLVDAWSREGDHYQRLVAIKNLARAQLAQGNQSSYLEAVDAYVEGARSLPSKQRFGAALNLAGLFAQAGDVRRSLVAVSDAASHAEIDELELTTYLLAWLGERRQGQSVSPVDWRAALQRFADVRDRHR
jgi:hypothetical protein